MAMVVKWDEQWVEVFALVFIVLGFMVAVLLQNPVWSYASVFCSGFVGGRVYYVKRFREPILPFILIIVGFLLGYLLGAIWASRILIFAFFCVGFALSYYLHDKKILVTFKSEDYVK